MCNEEIYNEIINNQKDILNELSEIKNILVPKKDYEYIDPNFLKIMRRDLRTNQNDQIKPML